MRQGQERYDITAGGSKRGGSGSIVLKCPCVTGSVCSLIDDRFRGHYFFIDETNDY